jgi:outer membrane protein assembly factor BamD
MTGLTAKAQRSTFPAMNRKLWTLFVLLGLCSCATLDATGEVIYLPDARGNYDAGMSALKSGRHLDAIKFFDHVRYKFPYSLQAPLADLGVADTNFDREKFVEAIDGYRNFLKLHPNHGKADYAQFRIAMSFYKDIPSDFFIFPPSAEKDQTSVKEARNAFDEFLKLYPASSYLPDGKKILTEVITRLSKHEMAVADFYLDHDRYPAAASRLSRLVQDFPQSELAPEALVKLAKTFLKMDQKDKAKGALERFLKDYPNDTRRPEAERLLKSIA